MRKLQQNGGIGSAVLDAEDDAEPRPDSSPFYRNNAVDSVRPRRELVDDFTEDADTEAFLRASGRNRRVRRGLIPSTRNGWIIAGVSLVAGVGMFAAGCFAGIRYMTRSDKFRIPSSQSIELDGNSHLSRAQMLSVFGEDVEGNIFAVPLQDRRAQLEQMPWVDHATVMRLLPNRLRVQVTERVPVAYLRQGGTIGLVDAAGVLLDIPPDAPGNPSYSFPVITGIKTTDDAASRNQRMQLYAAFLKDLDGDGKGTSALLSEVDLSDAEDVKALIPDHNQDVLVHFGTEAFLSRYRKFQDHIGEWRSQYPRLSSVDMRYERQVVLQMPPRDSTVTAAATPAPADETTAAAPAPKPAIPVKAPAAHAIVAKVEVPRLPVASPPGKAPVLAGKTITPAVTAPASKGISPVTIRQPAVVATSKPVVVPVSIPAAPAQSAAPVAKKATPAAGKATAAKEAETRKRVEAIKAWMAKREKARAATRAASAPSSN